MYTAWGSILLGWAKAQDKDALAGIRLIQQGLATWGNMGARLLVPNYQILLAQALGKAGEIESGLQQVSQAYAIMLETGERTYEAELHRRQGELLLVHKAATQDAERCFERALHVARQQSARSLELRAATSLSRLWLQQGKRSQARELLGGIYAWFEEGFDLPDLLEARDLLKELGKPP